MIKILKKNYFFLISLLLILYFFFNLLDGERGLFSYIKKKDNLKKLEIKENNYIEKIAVLENKNLLLSEIIDKDFIEMLIREKFLFGKQNEKVYIIKNNEN